jgi:hypothetical protein
MAAAVTSSSTSSSALNIGNPVWLRHDDAAGGLKLMVSPESFCNEDGQLKELSAAPSAVRQLPVVSPKGESASSLFSEDEQGWGRSSSLFSSEDGQAEECVPAAVTNAGIGMDGKRTKGGKGNAQHSKPCSSNPSTRSTRSSSSIDFPPESDGTPAPSNGIPTSLSISLEEQLKEQQRHHPHSDTKASSQDQPRRYKDIWSTMKAVAHAGIDPQFVEEGNAQSNKLGSSAGVEPNWPSGGSGNHALGQCKPCAFFHSPQGCQTGRDCKFCHLCPPREVQRRKRIRRRIARQQEEINQNQQLAMRVAAHPATAYAAWLGGSYLGYAADAAALSRWPLEIYDKIL